MESATTSVEQTIGIGVLGCGRIARQAVLDPAQSVPGIEVVAVGSRDPQRAAAYADEHGISHSGDYKSLMSNPDVDVVYITLPPSHHADAAIRALEAGKHVLCEKPLAANAADAARIVEAARRADRRVIEGYHYLHHPFAARAKELVAGGELGRLRNVEATFHIPEGIVQAGNIRLDSLLGGGALMDVGCYLIHFLRQALGEPEVLHATATTDTNDPQVDLSMTIDLEFPNAIAAHVETSFLGERRPGDRRFRFVGEDAVLECDSLTVPQWGGRLTLRKPDGSTTVEEAVSRKPSRHPRMCTNCARWRRRSAPRRNH